MDARRSELFTALYRPVPGGMQRLSDHRVGRPDDLASELMAAGEECLLVGDGAVRYEEVFEGLRKTEIVEEGLAYPSASSLVMLAHARAPARGLGEALGPAAAVPASPGCRDQLGHPAVRMTVTGPSGKPVDRPDPSLTGRDGGLEAADVTVEAMRRRHLRGVLRIEGRTSTTPWSLGLFVAGSDGATSASTSWPARPAVIGFAGALLVAGEAHVTTIAVDPITRLARWPRGCCWR